MNESELLACELEVPQYKYLAVRLLLPLSSYTFSWGLCPNIHKNNICSSNPTFQYTYELHLNHFLSAPWPMVIDYQITQTPVVHGRAPCAIPSLGDRWWAKLEALHESIFQHLRAKWKSLRCEISVGFIEMKTTIWVHLSIERHNRERLHEMQFRL